MKKIYDGKLYDTETASLVGTWDDSNILGDLSSQTKSLYVKRNGEYFLYETSKINVGVDAKESDILWQITPIDFEYAKKWAENWLDADVYIEHFNYEEFDGKEVKTLGAAISVIAYRKLKQASSDRKETMGKILEELINKEFD